MADPKAQVKLRAARQLVSKGSIAVKKKLASRSITHESGKSPYQIEMYGV
jgi:hypothetical protein